MPNDDSSESNRRQHERIRKPMSVRFRDANDAKAAWDMVVIQNISAGGLGFHYNREIPPGTELQMKVNTGLDLPVEECQGVVRQNRTVHPNVLYAVGVMFKDLTLAQQELFTKLSKT